MHVTLTGVSPLQFWKIELAVERSEILVGVHFVSFRGPQGRAWAVGAAVSVVLDGRVGAARQRASAVNVIFWRRIVG